MLMGSRRVIGAKGARGFSLIELLTALVLLAILIRLGLPGFTAWINNAKVRTVAESLQTGIRLAQAEAVRGNRQVVLTFTNTAPDLGVAAVAGGQYWSLQSVPMFGNNTDDETKAKFIQGGMLTDVASGVTIAASGASINAICFNSNGRLVANASPGPSGASCAANSATFVVNHPSGDRPLSVIVGIGGQTRTCDPKRPSTAPDGCP